MALRTFHDESNGGRRSVEVTDRELMLAKRAWLRSRETRIPFDGIESVSVERGPKRSAIWLSVFLAWMCLLTANLFFGLQSFLDAQAGFVMGLMAVLFALGSVVVLVFGRPTMLVVRSVSGHVHDVLNVDGLSQDRVHRAVEAISAALPGPMVSDRD